MTQLPDRPACIAPRICEEVYNNIMSMDETGEFPSGKLYSNAIQITTTIVVEL